MANLDGIQGILFDLDGVFYVGDQVIDGSPEVIKYFQEKHFPCRYVTNTTTKSIDALHQKLQGLGLPIERHEIISAPYAALLYLRQLQQPSCHLVLCEEVKQDFGEFAQTDTTPDAVVLGDIGRAWDYAMLNRVFQMVMSGAKLIALHKGKFWQTSEGLQMDIGAFVAGLEYATGTEATIIGKPSPAFFELSVNALELPKTKVAMVGDDIDSDVGGAQAVGLKGILVRTGKYRQEHVDSSPVHPDLTIDSVAELPRYF